MNYTVETLPEFDNWFDELRDQAGKRAILARIVRVQSGLFGNVEPVGEGVSELKIDLGPGYRVYFVTKGRTVVVLLCGGDKSTQRRDIKKAKELAAAL